MCIRDRHGGLDDRVENVRTPTVVVVDVAGGARVAPMEQERVEVSAEGVAALGEGPVRRAHGLEAPGGAVGARVHARQTELVDGLTHAGRLPALPGAEDDLHGPAPLAQARDEHVGGVAPIHRPTLQRIAQRSEHYCSTYRAKQRVPGGLLGGSRAQGVAPRSAASGSSASSSAGADY